MKFAGVISVVVMLTLPIAAHPSPTTAGQLEMRCRESIAFLDGDVKASITIAADIGECTGYIEGWWEAATSSFSYVPLEPKVPYYLELEDGVTIGRIARVFVKYMGQHPEKENKPATLGLMDALFDAKLAKYTEMPVNPHVVRPD